MSLDWSKIEINLLRAGKSRWPVGHRAGPNWFRSNLSAFDFWFVFRGRGVFQSPLGQIPIGRGTCLWLKSGVNYVVTQDHADTLGLYFAHFNIKGVDSHKHPIYNSLPGEAYKVGNPGFFQSSFSRIANLCYHHGHFNAHEGSAAWLQATHLLWGLLIEYDREARLENSLESGTPLRHRSMIKAVIRNMLQHPSEATATTVNQIAAKHGYSLGHFVKTFHKMQGVTPKQFLQAVRFREADKLLQDSDLGIGDIADLLGYANTFSFSKAFSKRTGMSPSAYRRKKSRVD